MTAPLVVLILTLCAPSLPCEEREIVVDEPSVIACMFTAPRYAAAWMEARRIPAGRLRRVRCDVGRGV